MHSARDVRQLKANKSERMLILCVFSDCPRLTGTTKDKAQLFKETERSQMQGAQQELAGARVR